MRLIKASTLLIAAIVALYSCNKAPSSYSPITQPWVGTEPFSGSVNGSMIIFPNTADYNYTTGTKPSEDFTFTKNSDSNKVDKTFVQRTLKMTHAGNFGINVNEKINVTTGNRELVYIWERKSYATPYDSTKYVQKLYTSLLPGSDASILVTKRDTLVTAYVQGKLMRKQLKTDAPWVTTEAVQLENGYIKIKP